MEKSEPGGNGLLTRALWRAVRRKLALSVGGERGDSLILAPPSDSAGNETPTQLRLSASFYRRRTGSGTGTEVRGVAKRFTIDNVVPMHAAQTSFRILTWCCVILLAVLSLLPAQDMVRTGMPGQIEHFVAYAGSAGIAIAGYGRRSAVRIIFLFGGYAGVLEYLQHFSPGRHPSMVDFAASALGASFGGLAAALLVRALWKGVFGRHLI